MARQVWLPTALPRGFVLPGPRSRPCIRLGSIHPCIGGFPDMGIFAPLESGLHALSEHTGIEILGSIRRHTSMAFVDKGLRLKARDDALTAIEAAERELVEFRRISTRTKRAAERPIDSTARIVLMANAMNGSFEHAHDPA